MRILTRQQKWGMVFFSFLTLFLLCGNLYEQFVLHQTADWFGVLYGFICVLFCYFSQARWFKREDL